MLTWVSGLKVTVLWVLGAGRDVEGRGLCDCGSSGDDSVVALAIMCSSRYSLCLTCKDTAIQLTGAHIEGSKAESQMFLVSWQGRLIYLNHGCPMEDDDAASTSQHVLSPHHFWLIDACAPFINMYHRMFISSKKMGDNFYC